MTNDIYLYKRSFYKSSSGQMEGRIHDFPKRHAMFCTGTDQLVFLVRQDKTFGVLTSYGLPSQSRSSAPLSPSWKIENTLYGVPQALLQQSPFFSSMLENINTGGSLEGKSDDTPIKLGGITTHEMDNFLTLLYSQKLAAKPCLSIDQWSAALHLSTMWAFDVLRTYAIAEISSYHPNQCPFDRIDLAMRCQVAQWLFPSYESICTRWEPLTTEEMMRLGFMKLTAISRIREAICRSRKGDGSVGLIPVARLGSVKPFSGQDMTKTALHMIKEAKELEIPFNDGNPVNPLTPPMETITVTIQPDTAPDHD
ncbi:hypothetical protein FRB96_005926 [Tulasnella sp. 330]|nr:hypothetical protein FRB96_005926 [Tulasnella sp. 330]